MIFYKVLILRNHSQSFNFHHLYHLYHLMDIKIIKFHHQIMDIIKVNHLSFLNNNNTILWTNNSLILINNSFILINNNLFQINNNLHKLIIKLILDNNKLNNQILYNHNLLPLRINFKEIIIIQLLNQPIKKELLQLLKLLKELLWKNFIIKMRNKNEK